MNGNRLAIPDSERIIDALRHTTVVKTRICIKHFHFSTNIIVIGIKPIHVFSKWEKIKIYSKRAVNLRYLPDAVHHQAR